MGTAFAFSYFDVVTVVLQDDAGESFEATSGRRNLSSKYFIDAGGSDHRGCG